MVHRFFACSVLYRFAYAAGFLGLAALLIVPRLFAQTESATVLGRVSDQSGAVIKGVEVDIRNIDTNVVTTSSTNAEGLYAIHSLPPGRYVISVHKQGFKAVSLTGLNLNVQDNLIRNFTLQIGAASESITVSAESGTINTIDASVSTVVDRNFADNLPMNGRSFQTLIQLAPGVVVTRSTPADSGQFSVNGQRPSSNYWTVDGVSANTGAGAAGTAGNAFGGSVGAFSVLGGTNSLVSVDAMQEFRIQTSTYAPEFGRTPGAQISVVTRSGTNQWHGSAFNYIRNDVLDANNWFNGFTNNPALPKAKERQNDFGGTISGPIHKDRTFFFFSYEGLRLRLPQTALTTVPDLAARQNASPGLQPFLNAYPKPNGQDSPATGIAQFNASYSNPAALDAYSIRVDHRIGSRLSLFGRYNYSPSSMLLRGANSSSLSVVSPSKINLQTATAGITWAISAMTTNDFRFNYSGADASNRFFLDDFGGAIPLDSTLSPSQVTGNSNELLLGALSLSQGFLITGQNTVSRQRQINVVDDLSHQVGRHSIKWGTDFRRLAPTYEQPSYLQQDFFASVPAFSTGNLLISNVFAFEPAQLLFHNIGVFAQDTWQVLPRLTVTYGIRWDTDVSPVSTNGINIPAVTGFDPNDLSQLALAPSGTSVFHTTFGNFAPRLGAAYQVTQNPNWETVLRGGFGVFFDLATSEVGNSIGSSFPFGARRTAFGGTFPLDGTVAAPPSITAASLSSGTLFAFDPQLKLPYTLQWDTSLEQAFGRQQVLSLSYIGATGRRLLRSLLVSAPNPNFGAASLVTNSATSDYDALQAQFRRRLSRGVQCIASYTWSHSIDDASAGSTGITSNALIPSLGPNIDRGPSSFDIRHAASIGATYDIQTSVDNEILKALIQGWSLQNVLQVRSATPVNVFDGKFATLLNATTQVRPDVVSGVPLYLLGSQFPGGRALNPAAFVDPPTQNGLPVRQGNLERNGVRGFGASQWDFAIHREFALREPLRLQFRAELFNVLNHPNFGSPVSDINNKTQFGQATSMLSQSLSAGNVGGGALNPLYQIGGPRSVQFALKLSF